MENLTWHKIDKMEEAYFQKFYLHFRQPASIEAWIRKSHHGYSLGLGQQYNPVYDTLGEDSDRKDYETPDELIAALTQHGFIPVQEMEHDFWGQTEKCRQMGASEEWLKAVEDWRDYVMHG